MDWYLFQQLNQFAGQFPWLDNLGIFFAKYFGYILVALVFLIFLKKWKIILQSFLAAIFARLVITELIRWLWYRPRPFIENSVNLILDKTQASAFPSGHAAFYFAIATVVYFYNKKAGIFFFFASFLIAISRVFSGIHWPSDIIAGAIIGIFSGWLVLKIFKKF